MFFCETWERALAEVERANQIVALYPNTISMGHLRDMDADWRRERGLPLPPEPEGRRIVVPAPAGGSLVSEGDPAPRPAGETAAPARTAAVSAVLALAAEVAARREMELRVEQAREDLDRTAQLTRGLGQVAREADQPAARLRAAFQALYGEHAHGAEEVFRRAALERGPEHAAALLRDDPRALVPGLRLPVLEGGLAARAAAVEQARASGPALRRLDAALAAACDHAGLAPPASFADAAETRRAVLARLLDLVPAQRAVLAEAAEDERRLGSPGSAPDLLRSGWASLPETDQQAVRSAMPGVERLLAPVGRGGPSPEL